MTSKFTTTSCLVPFYNESSRVLKVLASLAKVKNLTEIIAVNDGSTDNAPEQIAEKFPRVKLLTLSSNRGKTRAIIEGLSKSRGENILLFDADLSGLIPSQIENAIDVFGNRPELDMIILRRMNDPWIARLLRTDTTISGQRLLRTRDLKKILSIPPKRFGTELAINDYMIREGKHVGWMPLVCSDIRKLQKYGFLKGAVRELKMYRDLLFYKNPVYYLWQLLTFCYQKIRFSPASQSKKNLPASKNMPRLKAGHD